jgi:hypothetical protein
MKLGSMYTAVMLVLILCVLSMIPRFLNGEGFTSMSPANTYSSGYESRGPLDGRKTDCDDLVVGQQIDGPISVVRTGGSAFAPATDPKVDLKRNQLYEFVRNKTSTDTATCLSSNLSTSTGCVIPTMKQVKDLDSRGGNRASGVFI